MSDTASSTQTPHLVLCVLLGAALFACSTSEPREPEQETADNEASPEKDAPPKSDDATKTTQPARLTLVHGGIGVDALTVLINGKPLEGLEPLKPFDGALARFDAPPGSILLAIAPPPEAKSNVQPPPWVTKPVALASGASYLVLVAGVRGERVEGDRPLNLHVVPQEGPAEVEPGKALLRVVHGVVNAPPVDVSSDRAARKDALALVNVGFGKASAFHPVSAGPELLEFRSGLDASAKPIYAAQNTVLAPDTRTTLLLLGRVGSETHPPRLWLWTPEAETARAL